MLAIVAPGQGAQTPGFLSPWLKLPGFADRLHWLSTVAGLDLAELGTTADADTIRDTAVAQPLLVSAGLVSLLELFPHPADAFDVVGVGAGHSVGEITAAAGAHVISAEQAMVLVRERGRAMATAAAVTATGMTAVLGGDPEEVRAALGRHGLTAANDNGPGQLVAAGTMEQLAALAADPPAKARLIPLQVAGAFHTEHMAPAVDVLGRCARAVSVDDPRTRLLSNRDGTVVHSGREVLSRLVQQVATPVRWDLCLRTMADLGVTGLIELPPAGTLVGLARRGLPGVETVALKTPEDLPKAWALVERHGTPSPLDDSPTWRLLVAPAAGTFRVTAAPAANTITLPAGPGQPGQPSAAGRGGVLDPGAQVGVVVTRRGDQPVAAPYGGTVVEWLVEDGDPVSPGQPLVRLHPAAVPA